MVTGKVRIVRKLNHSSAGDGDIITLRSIGTGEQVEGRSDRVEEESREFADSNTGAESEPDTCADSDSNTGADSEASFAYENTKGAIDPASVQPRQRRRRRTKEEMAAARARGEVPLRPGVQPIESGIKAEHLLATIHTGLAVLLNAPEFGDITDDDMKMVLDRFRDMSRAYGWHSGIVDPRVLSTIAMLEALSIVYGPRAFRVYQRVKEESRIHKVS